MRNSDIINIFLKAVSRYKYPASVARCGGVKSFAVVQDMDDFKDIDQTNAGKFFRDYTQGLFWSHEWYFSGADENRIHREFPILCMAKVGSNEQNGRACYDYQFWLLEREDCKNCPAECQRPNEILLDDSEATLKKILNYVKGFRKFSVTLANDTVVEIWDTAEYLLKQVELTKAKSFRDLTTIDKHIDFDSYRQYLDFNRETKLGLLGKGVALKFCGCVIEQGEFLTDVPVPNFVGHSNCVLC